MSVTKTSPSDSNAHMHFPSHDVPVTPLFIKYCYCILQLYLVGTEMLKKCLVQIFCTPKLQLYDTLPPPTHNKHEQHIFCAGREQNLAFSTKLSKHCNCNPAYYCLLLEFTCLSNTLFFGRY